MPRGVLDQGKSATVYILMDDDLEVIYVGMTSNQLHRMREHSKDKPWWNEVRGARFEHYETRQEAFEAEEAFIKHYLPKYNKDHMPKPLAEPDDEGLLFVGMAFHATDRRRCREGRCDCDFAYP